MIFKLASEMACVYSPWRIPVEWPAQSAYRSQNIVSCFCLMHIAALCILVRDELASRSSEDFAL
jgi:hypothetical protein